MRVLATTVPSLGHLHPLIPFARALRARGHEVVVATASELSGAVQGSGLGFAPAGVSEAAMVERMRSRAAASDAFPAAERGLRMFAEEAAPTMARDLLERVERAPPALIVHEEGEWAAPIVAARFGVPSVTVGWGAPMWSPAELRLIDAAVRPLWSHHGVRPRSPAGLFDHLFLDRCPPLLQDPAAAAQATLRRVRYEPAEVEAAPVDAAPGDWPEVYVTLGTVPTFNRAPRLLAAVVEALLREPVRVHVTVGPGGDRGVVPEHPRVRVAEYVPQAQALAGSALAVTHGGAGSTLGALSFGLPLLILPRGAPSQRRMAERCAAAGAAIALREHEISAASLHDAVRRLLHDPRYRKRAEAVREQLSQLPPAAEAASWLEELASR